MIRAAARTCRTMRRGAFIMAPDERVAALEDDAEESLGREAEVVRHAREQRSEVHGELRSVEVIVGVPMPSHGDAEEFDAVAHFAVEGTEPSAHRRQHGPPDVPGEHLWSEGKVFFVVARRRAPVGDADLRSYGVGAVGRAATGPVTASGRIHRTRRRPSALRGRGGSWIFRAS